MSGGRRNKLGWQGFSGLVGIALVFAAAIALLWAAKTGLVGSKGSKVTAWPASQFAQLAWLGILSMVGSLAVLMRGQSRRPLLLGSLAGMLAFATGFTVVGVAWAGGRQNYWDAIHFSSLIWLSAVGAIGSLVAARVAARRGSDLGRVLQGPALVCVLLVVLGWLWTWFPPLQELQADLARFFFLKLHG